MVVESQLTWQQGRVVSTELVAAEIRKIVLSVDDPQPVTPGAHVDVQVEIAGRKNTRSYSIVSAESAGRLLTLGVQLSARSRGGSVFMHGLRPGQDVTLSRPLQNFPLRVGASRYVLVAGGVGITAIAHMASVLRRLEADYSLVYVGRSRRSMAFLPELQQLHRDALHLHIDDEGSNLDVAALVAEIASDLAGTEAYVCGPIRLLDAARREWLSSGLSPSELRFETFGSSGRHDAEEFVVRIPRLDIEAVIPVGRSILEALEDSGVELMSDCRKGECGLCEVNVLDVVGQVDHRDVFYSEEQRVESRRLCTCVSRVVAVGAPEGTTSDRGDGAVVSPRAVVTLDIP